MLQLLLLTKQLSLIVLWIHIASGRGVSHGCQVLIRVAAPYFSLRLLSNANHVNSLPVKFLCGGVGKLQPHVLLAAKMHCYPFSTSPSLNDTGIQANTKIRYVGTIGARDRVLEDLVSPASSRTPTKVARCRCSQIRKSGKFLSPTLEAGIHLSTTLYHDSPTCCAISP